MFGSKSKQAQTQPNNSNVDLEFATRIKDELDKSLKNSINYNIYLNRFEIKNSIEKAIKNNNFES